MQQLLTCGGDSMAYNLDDNLPCDLANSRSQVWTTLERDMQWRTCLQVLPRIPHSPSCAGAAACSSRSRPLTRLKLSTVTSIPQLPLAQCCAADPALTCQAPVRRLTRRPHPSQARHPCEIVWAEPESASSSQVATGTAGSFTSDGISLPEVCAQLQAA